MLVPIFILLLRTLRQKKVNWLPKIIKLVRKPGLKSVWLQTPNSSHYANKFGGSSEWSQKSQKPLVLQESYQVMRTEFLKYSVILILVNFPLVINPLMKEAVKVSKLTKWSLAGLKTRLFFPSQASASFSFFSLGKVSPLQSSFKLCLIQIVFIKQQSSSTSIRNGFSLKFYVTYWLF